MIIDFVQPTTTGMLHLLYFVANKLIREFDDDAFKFSKDH